MRNETDRGISEIRVRHVPDTANDILLVTLPDRLCLVGTVCKLVDRADVEHTHHAGHDAVGLAACLKFVDAEVAFLDDLVFRVVLGCAEGTGRLAAAAPDTERRVDIDHAVVFAFEQGPGRARRQARGFSTVVARHIHLVGEDIGIGSTLDVLHATEPGTGRQTVLVLAGNLACTAANAVDIVVDESILHVGNDGGVGLLLRRGGG